jgi:programmed cell death 6-interacting protein
MPHRKLQELSLPTTLDMLDRPLDLPQSLLGKAREVRSEDGPRRIRGMIEDVQKLAAQDRILLNAVSIFALSPLPPVPLTL